MNNPGTLYPPITALFVIGLSLTEFPRSTPCSPVDLSLPRYLF